MFSYNYIGENQVCADELIGELDIGDRSCQCGVGCSAIEYQLSLSQSSWPSKQYEVWCSIKNTIYAITKQVYDLN